jgi:heparanase 1
VKLKLFFMKILNANSLIVIPASIIMCSCNSGPTSGSESITLNPAAMPHIGVVDERFQSYNVEMVEVAGGQFWKPYHLMDSLPSISASSTYDVSQKNDQLYRQLAPINLADKRLMNLAKGLAPAYVRVSGTWANAIYFQDNDKPQMTKAPAGFVNVVTQSQWKGVINFIKATDSKLVTSFAVSNGVRNAQGVWTAKEAQKIASYTKSQGGEIAAAELFNEPTMPTAGGEINKDYNGGNFAKDVAAFNAWSKATVPEMLVLGPGSVGEGSPNVSLQGMGMSYLSTDAMLSAEPKPHFDVFSYHYYGAASMRMMRSGPFSTKAENALNDSWLRKTDTVANYYAGLRDKYNPGNPLWITETAQAAAGGDPYAATYLDCFRYLYQLGSLAKKGVKVIMHNTLVASEYSLIDQDTHLPKPNYWAALLWAKLMGTEVYDAGKGAQGLYVFAHNMKGHKAGRTILVINNNKQPTSINITNNAEQYTLTSTELQGNTVQLNGRELKLEANDELPALKGNPVKAGNVTLPSTSISFFTIAEAKNENRK